MRHFGGYFWRSEKRHISKWNSPKVVSSIDGVGSDGGGDSVGTGGYSYEAVCEQVYITHMR